MGIDARSPDGHVGGEPDQRTCGSCRRNRASEDENGAVEDGADDHPSDLRHPVRRKFERERRRRAAQDGDGQDFRCQQGHADRKEEHPDHRGRGQSRAESETGEHGENGGETSVAGNEGIGEDGDFPFARGIDDAAARDAGGVAAETHEHRKRLFSARSAAGEAPVEGKCRTREVAEVFKNGEQREENRHRRKHHGDHAEDRGDHAVAEKKRERLRKNRGQRGAEVAGKEGQTRVERGGKISAAGEGQPEHGREQKEQAGNGGEPSAEDAVDLPVAHGRVTAVFHGYAGCRDFRRAFRRGSGEVGRFPWTMIHDGGFQFVETGVLPCRREDDGASGHGFEFSAVDGDSFFLRFVGEIDTEDHVVREIADLHGENQAPLKTAGVADADDGIGVFADEKIPCGILFRRMAGERIDARQVGDGDGSAVRGKCTFGDADRFSGPVAGMLMQTGEGVEDGAFSDVRIPGEGGGDDFCVFVHPLTSPTATMDASARRRAMTAPRMR